MKNMPGWTKALMSERKFRKAVIRAAKFDTMEIRAMWSNGNAWYGWENGPRTNYAWRKVPLAGMYSQAYVPVMVEGRTYRQPGGAGKECHSVTFRTEEAAWVSFWDWHDDEGGEVA